MVEKANMKFGKKREVEIPVEIEGKTQIAVLEIDEVFAPSKIDACVKEFVSNIDAVRKSSGDSFKSVIEAFMIFMIIKHFSDFPSPNTYKEQVKVINMLSETDLLYIIYSKFDQKEIEKMYLAVEGVTEILEDKIGEYLDLAKEMGIDKALENIEEGEVNVKS
jgi:hypothetical protein